MKNYSTIINEDVITLPQFTHPDLINPRDPDGKFWMAIKAANDVPEKASKTAYNKAIKMAKDLYSALVAIGDPDVKGAMKMTNDIVSLLEKSSKDTIEETGTSDIKALKTYLFIISNIDNVFKTKTWFKTSHVDVKAGYVPFRGASKDPKVKYRMVYTLENPVSEDVAKGITKTILTLSPLHKDYVASVEWKRDRTAFMINISNTAGYKR